MTIIKCEHCCNAIDSEDRYRNLLTTELLDEIERLRDEVERLKRQETATQHLLNKVNRVTSNYRHHNKVSAKDLDALCNAQLEYEALEDK